LIDGGLDGGEERLIALRDGTALGTEKDKAPIAGEAERVERCIVARDCTASFYRVDVKCLDEH